jgi:hypothetical protein
VAGGGSFTAAVTATGGWTASSNQSWLTITSGTPGNNNGTIGYTVANHTGSSSRQAVVTVTGSGGSATLTVDQAGVVVNPPPSINPTTNNVVAGGGSFTATVTATGGWTASSNQSWLTITSGTPGNNNGTIGYTVANHTGSSSRQAVVTVTASGGSATLTVDQAGVVVNPPPSINPTTNNVVAGGGSFTAQVTATGGWTASSNQSWLTITSGTPGNNNGTMGYTVANHTGSSSRQAVITVTGSGGSATLTVDQAGVVVVPPPTINPTVHNNVAAGGGGPFSANVGATGGWTASSNQGWLMIITGTSGTGNGTVTYNVAANSGGARQGVITVSNSSGSATLTVNQDAGAVTVSFTVTKTTPNNPPACEVVASPSGSPEPNQIRCRFDASASQGAISAYSWFLAPEDDPTFQFPLVPSSQPPHVVVTDPFVRCGLGSAQTSIRVIFTLRVTTSGGTLSTTRTGEIIKPGGC